MCVEKRSAHKGCLKGEEHRPEECTPEQVRMCHGEVLEHPCTRRDKRL